MRKTPTRCEVLGVCQSIGCPKCKQAKLEQVPVKVNLEKWRKAFSRPKRPKS
jgi:hypothetical protein